MYPYSQRKKSRTQTVMLDSICWKIRAEHGSQTDALQDVDIQRLASKHAIDEELLRQLSRKVASILCPELKLSQPNVTDARRKKGLKELARANDLIRSAEGKLQSASKILENLGFIDDFAHVGRPNPSDAHVAEFATAIQTVKECCDFFEIIEKHEMVTFFGTPDARKASDVRRTILCVTIFNMWLKLDRELTYTTNPVSSERTGPLIEFINDVGQSIKRELEDFLGGK
jgi:hypothetical protein